ncbi:hypothetical protein EMPS_05345 [Entomortierella parvispora]|uniref:C2 domain-containing protein n=1 Tax=Entomortierella parvispora TaxID=205924 RepID=A0A9P3HAA4_9FUNG|nr:hypothetical protein EMPS_05345 [Entomortierella parvispora]
MRFITLAAALLAPMAAMAVSKPVVEDDGAINTMASKKGQLYVKLNSASKLTDKDLFGKSDPFIEMWLEKAYKHRSKDTKGLNPIFNETFCFYVRSGQNKLYVRAVDKDTFSNDKIGDTTINLDQVFNSGNVGPQDYKLPKWLGFSDNGSVNMQMQFVEDTSS